MKTVMQYWAIRSAVCLATILTLCTACAGEEELSSQSVVEQAAVQRAETELDTWILENFTRPYGIEVQYRWDRNTSQSSSYTYPPDTSHVKAVLQTIQALWLELYTDSSIGGTDFFLGKNPLKIYMYGGSNLDGNGVKLIGNSEAATEEMYLYDVNNFDATDADKVYILMRSVHHQFAKRLMEVYPYDRNKFLTVSRNNYLASTRLFAQIFLNKEQGRELFELSGYANKRGFFTYHSMLSLEDDFAEIISSNLNNTAKEILLALKTASEPDYAGEEDEELQATYDEEARQAYKELSEKQAFVESYFTETVKISLPYLQLVSVKKLKAYTAQ